MRKSLFGTLAALLLAPSAAASAATSVQSGSWNDPATWGGVLPGLGEEVTIAAGHIVHFPVSQDYTVELDSNLIVLGTLQMRPQEFGEPYYQHVIRFLGVDETQFIGGGTFSCGSTPPATDVGIWVLCDGVLDLQGDLKLGWARANGDLVAGATSITLDAVPTGWREGDVITVAPTEHPSVGDRSWSGFEEVVIAHVGPGNTVHFQPALAHDHPCAIGFDSEAHCAEVANLSRNVRIEGTGNGSASFQPSANGRAHILIQSSAPQSIKYAEMVLLGSRGPDIITNRDPTDGRLGRYPLHFHHSGDGSRGSLVEGVVVRQSGNRAVVPHHSNGITVRDTVAYDVWEDAFWWDGGDANQSHDVRFERVFAGWVQDDPDFRGTRLAGWELQRGANTAVVDSVAVGIRGNVSASGFEWPENANNAQFNVWEFERNVAHNNRVTGIFVWQNDSNNHIIRDFTSFNNTRRCVQHGAYRNVYEYVGLDCWGHGQDGIFLQAKPRFAGAERADGYLLAWEDVRLEQALVLGEHVGDGNGPTLFLDSLFEAGVTVNETGTDGQYDFVDSGVEPEDFDVVQMQGDSWIRVQRPDCTAFRMDGPGGVVSTITAFYDFDRCGGEPPPPPDVPTATLTADPATILQGETSTLTWGSTNADSCAGTGFSTGGAVSGSVGVTPASTTTYEVDCTGAGGVAEASATVTVIIPVSFVGSASVGAANGDPVTVDLTPLSLASGDVVVLATVTTEKDGTGEGAPTTPGYANLVDISAGGSGTVGKLQVWWKRMGASPDAAVSVSDAGLGGLDSMVAAVHVWRGVGPADPIATTSQTADGPAITTQADGSAVLSIVATGGLTPTQAFGYANTVTRTAADTRSSGVGIASIIKAAAGPEDPGAWTNGLRTVTVAMSPAVQ